jgi:hypothetical protein
LFSKKWSSFGIPAYLEASKASWRSPVYNHFDVVIWLPGVDLRHYHLYSVVRLTLPITLLTIVPESLLAMEQRIFKMGLRHVISV